MRPNVIIQIQNVIAVHFKVQNTSQPITHVLIYLYIKQFQNISIMSKTHFEHFTLAGILFS